jgi:phosphatidate cytidylyltransferase
MPLVHWLALALTVSVFGVLGDLFESLIKRHAHVKDAGNLIPGHGGLLDRFDDVLFVLPLAALYLLLVGLL